MTGRGSAVLAARAGHFGAEMLRFGHIPAPKAGTGQFQGTAPSLHPKIPPLLLICHSQAEQPHFFHLPCSGGGSALFQPPFPSCKPQTPESKTRLVPLKPGSNLPPEPPKPPSHPSLAALPPPPPPAAGVVLAWQTFQESHLILGGLFGLAQALICSQPSLAPEPLLFSVGSSG